MEKPPPPPVASPTLPPEPLDVQTDPGLRIILDRREVDQMKRAVLEAENAAAKALAEGKQKGAAWLISTVVAAVGISFAAYAQVMDSAKRVAADAGTELGRQVKYLREDSDRLEDRVKRIETMLELSLDKQKVPKTARPEPIAEPDAGVRRPTK